jgi:hypothetical protein
MFHWRSDRSIHLSQQWQRVDRSTAQSEREGREGDKWTDLAHVIN